MGHITPSRHRQQHGVLGLTLQTTNYTLPQNAMNISDTSLQAVPEEKITTCPVHNALLEGWHAGTAISQATAFEPKDMTLPMDRYLAEGQAERYALLSLSHPETGGEWARYSSCLCGK
jgi:hypothetical protein